MTVSPGNRENLVLMLSFSWAAIHIRRFYPQMARLSKEFVPLVETGFYIHNFKGLGGGALFRAFPGPWQVLLRLSDGMRVVHTQEERPSLKEVALEILPTAVRALR